MKLFRRLLLAVVAAVGLGAAAVGLVLWRSIPPLGGEAALPGLEAPVSVALDALGVPHIVATSDADALRALGYLHARDRLWQMEVQRHAAEGRLAEMLGPAAVPSDRYLRTLDIPHAAARSLERMAPATRALLEAYAEGVHRAMSRPPRGRPPELLVLRHRPEPWTALHSAEVARLMAWDLAAGDGELALARAASRVGLERVRELFPTYPESAAVILARGTGTWSARTGRGEGGRSRERTGRDALPGVVLAEADLPEVPALARAVLAGAGMAPASNAWVVGPARSRSGKPLLANDPHLELRAPALWYLAALESPGLRVAGATIPGLPGVILGRNRRIAWGLTNIELDDVDFVIERLSADSARVLSSEGWQPVEVVRDSIRVRGAGAVPFTLRRTGHGPLVATRREITGAAADGEVRAVSMRWTGHDPSDELSAVLGVNRAGDWEAFLAALASWKTPEQSWIYADVDGNIGYAAAGAVPVRRGGRGLLPTPGWTDEGRWERYLDFDELPRALNPAEGFIVTANHRIVGDEYPHPLEARWAAPWRAERIRELLRSGGPFAADDLRRIQMDTLDGFARSAKDLAARAADAIGRGALAQRLRGWDGTVGADRTEPTLFYVWYRALQRLTFEDELGGTYFPGSPFQAWLRAGASRWFDDVRTPPVEDLAALAARAMSEAAPLADTRWGSVHTTLGEHVLGDVAPLKGLLRLNVGPRARAGSLYTVNVGDFGRLSPPFVNTHAASFRQVVDLAAPEEAGVILTTGQAGHPLSRRYRDQVERWWRGELVPLPLSRSRVAPAATLRLVPGP